MLAHSFAFQNATPQIRPMIRDDVWPIRTIRFAFQAENASSILVARSKWDFQPKANVLYQFWVTTVVRCWPRLSFVKRSIDARDARLMPVNLILLTTLHLSVAPS